MIIEEKVLMDKIISIKANKKTKIEIFKINYYK